MNISFNDRLRQLLLLALIIMLAFMIIDQLYIFVPGILGGITLFILTRSLYFKLVYEKKWKKGLTAILFMLGCLVLVAIPIYFAIHLISPKINEIIHNPDKVVNNFRIFSNKIKDNFGIQILSEENTKNISSRLSSAIPKFLNSTATVLTNLIMMFFLMYYMLVNGKELQGYLHRAIPLKPENVDKLAAETQSMITANALGIPIICIVQGAFAALGYWIFDIEDWGMWGFVTGVFAFFPLVGTMIIWVPIVISQYAAGQNWMATGLTIYSIVVTGNVDYITRMGLLKKLGNVHPVVTVIGVIAGLNLFGFVGLIFGPLLVSYLIILVKIYVNEFSHSKNAAKLESS